MPKAILIAAAALIVAYALHRLASWAEDRGWIYYRKGRGRNWGVSSAAQELQSMLQPSSRHVIEEARREDLCREESGEDASK